MQEKILKAWKKYFCETSKYPCENFKAGFNAGLTEAQDREGADVTLDYLLGIRLAELFDLGWRIERKSCACGGSWAWLKPREGGAMETVGCVCHNTPRQE